MSLVSGLGGYLGLKLESTYGTSVTPDIFLPWVTQSLTDGIDQQYVTSAGILSGRRMATVDQTEPGMIVISGDTGIELHSENLEVILELMMGSDSTSGAGPYTHTYSMADLPSATIDIGVPERDTGTVRAFRFSGCKVASWQLSVAAGEYGRLGLTWVCQNVASETAETVSYNADAGKFHFVNADFQHDSSSLCVESVTISGDNGLETGKACLNQDYIDEPVQTALRTYELVAEARFQNLTLYNDFQAGNTETWDLNFTETVADDSLSINMQGKLITPSAPRMADGGAVMQTLTSQLLASNSDDDDAIEFILINDTA